jgi:hypothetical protein
MKKLIGIFFLGALLSGCNITMVTPAEGDQALDDEPQVQIQGPDTPDEVQTQEAEQQLGPIQDY